VFRARYEQKQKFTGENFKDPEHVKIKRLRVREREREALKAPFVKIKVKIR